MVQQINMDRKRLSDYLAEVSSAGASSSGGAASVVGQVGIPPVSRKVKRKLSKKRARRPIG